MSNPTDRRYVSSHEWIKDNGDGTFSVGISDHAQSELGDLVFVEIPEVGTEVSKGDAIAVVESVKAASDIYAPVAGTVCAANEELHDNPELINSSAFADGWMFKLEGVTAIDLEALLDAAAYDATIG